MVPELKDSFHLLISSRAMTNSATNTANLDTRGSDYATLVLNFKSEINTNAVGPTISVLHSDDTAASNFATVVADRTAEDITNGKFVCYHVDLKGKKRYLRLSVTTATATNDDVTVGAIAILSKKEEKPASTSDMRGSTNDAIVIVT